MYSKSYKTLQYMCLLLVVSIHAQKTDFDTVPADKLRISHTCNSEEGSKSCLYTVHVPQSCSNPDDMEGKIQRLSDELDMLKTERLHRITEQLDALRQDTTNQIQTLRQDTASQIQTLYSDISAMSLTMNAQESQPQQSSQQSQIYRDCSEVLQFNPAMSSGVYHIQPWDSPKPFYTYCEVNGTDVWTVLQRRQDGAVNFYKDWQAYKNGFGNRTGEFWLGNDNIYYLTSQGHYKLRIDLEDWEGNTRYAEYDRFRINSESEKYSIHVGEYKGDAGNAMRYHHDRKFTTKDNDNDGSTYNNCAEMNKGGWWYHSCQQSNLNGMYYKGGPYEAGTNDGIQWTKWKSSFYSLKKVAMKIKPVN